MKKLPWIFNAFVVLALVACATSPLGRQQIRFMNENQMGTMGMQAFEEMKKEIPRENDREINAYVRCIVNRIIPQIRQGPTVGKNWDVVVFKDPQINAFALPGEKIGVYTGLFKAAKTPAQVAAVLGHEVAHVVAQHGNERVSTAFAAQTTLALSGAVISQIFETKGTNFKLLMAALGLGAQVGYLLPHSRAQESEADVMGLGYMAAAGFNPEEAIQLWENMAKVGGGQPPVFLSTHPSHEDRIQKLRANLPKVEPIYQAAQSVVTGELCPRPNSLPK